MVYARCLYQVVIRADSHQREAYAITRGLLSRYLQHACHLMGSRMIEAGFGNGYASLFVDLSADISISEFIDRLRLWTSAWIVGGKSGQPYWMESYWYSCVSPGDRVRTMIDEGEPGTAIASGSMEAPGACHHIILLTSRYRLLIPAKYRTLMAQEAAGAAGDNGARVTGCTAMRNHLHLLCHVPAGISIAQFIDRVKTLLQQRMLANRHLRRAQGWSEHSVAWTVSPGLMSEEEHTVATQEAIHRRFAVNEMSPIYQRLGIPFITSLH